MQGTGRSHTADGLVYLHFVGIEVRIASWRDRYWKHEWVSSDERQGVGSDKIGPAGVG